MMEWRGRNSMKINLENTVTALFDQWGEEQ